MSNETVRIVCEMLLYFFNLKVHELPLNIAYFCIMGVIAYCTSMIVIGFPCSIWEAIVKKQLNYDKKQKIIAIVAKILFVVLLIRFLFEQVTKA